MKEAGSSQFHLPAPMDVGWAQGRMEEAVSRTQARRAAWDILRDIREEQAPAEDLGGRVRSHTKGGGPEI